MFHHFIFSLQANSSVKNLAALAFPSKLPNALWSFDDQYCCFEIVGVLIASIAKQTTCSTPDDSILQITNRVIAPLLSFFFAHDGMEGPSSALQALVETDFIGTADLITRKLTAFNHLTKRFTKSVVVLFRRMLLRCATALHFALRVGDSRFC